MAEVELSADAELAEVRPQAVQIYVPAFRRPTLSVRLPGPLLAFPQEETPLEAVEASLHYIPTR